VRYKLGLAGGAGDDAELIDSLFDELEKHSVDFTSFFRALAMLLRAKGAAMEALLPAPDAMAPWIAAWWQQIEQGAQNPLELAEAMDRVNPLYIPRNHLIEAALEAAEAGDLAPWRELLDVVRDPFVMRAGFERFAEPGPVDAAPYMTFCGT
jgi:uncharacterized protein YdiU (UPF0061 family)